MCKCKDKLHGSIGGEEEEINYTQQLGFGYQQIDGNINIKITRVVHVSSSTLQRNIDVF